MPTTFAGHTRQRADAPNFGLERSCSGILANVGAWLGRLVPLALLIAAAASVPLMLWSPSGLVRLELLDRQRRELALEAQRIERDIDRLRVQADAIKTSPSSIERVARDELGLVRQTEIVVQFKEP